MLDGTTGPAFFADVLSAMMRHAVCSVTILGTLLADRSCPGVIVMQPSVSVAQQLPTASSSMPLASTTAVVAGKFPSATTGFGDTLGKLLAVVAAADQPAASTVAAAAIAQATTDPPANVSTLQSGQMTSGAPVALAPPPPGTAIRAPSDAGTSKAPPETQPARRGTFPRATRASMPLISRLCQPVCSCCPWRRRCPTARLSMRRPQRHDSAPKHPISRKSSKPLHRRRPLKRQPRRRRSRSMRRHRRYRRMRKRPHPHNPLRCRPSD